MKLTTLRTLLPMVLLLTSAAACPIKPGYFANGAFKDTSGLTPLCGPAFEKLAVGIVAASEYGEIYKTTSGAAGAVKISKALGLLQASGWKPDGTIRNKAGTNYTFVKGLKTTVVLVQQQKDSVMVIVIGDK